MKNTKKILAAAIALPLMLGSVSALATSPMRPAPGVAAENKMADAISALFRGVELSAEQVNQLKANMAKIAEMKAEAVEEQVRLKKEEMNAVFFEGANLTKEQEQRIMANIAKLREQTKEQFVDFIKSKLAGIPQILPELSEQQPVADIPVAAN